MPASVWERTKALSRPPPPTHSPARVHLGDAAASASPTVSKGSGGPPTSWLPQGYGVRAVPPPPRMAGLRGLAAGGALWATCPQLSRETHPRQKGSGRGRVTGVP